MNRNVLTIETLMTRYTDIVSDLDRLEEEFERLTAEKNKLEIDLNKVRGELIQKLSEDSTSEKKLAKKK